MTIMSDRDFGEIKRALSNVIGAVRQNSTKMNLMRIQVAYLLKRVEKLEGGSGSSHEVGESESNVLKNLSSIDLSS